MNTGYVSYIFISFDYDDIRHKNIVYTYGNKLYIEKCKIHNLELVLTKNLLNHISLILILIKSLKKINEKNI